MVFGFQGYTYKGVPIIPASAREICELVDGREVQQVGPFGFVQLKANGLDIVVLVDIETSSNPPTPATPAGQESPQDARKPTKG